MYVAAAAVVIAIVLSGIRWVGIIADVTIGVSRNEGE